MKLTFLGADHEVTGSCTLIETGGKHVLVDFGMEQGADVYDNAKLPLAPGQVDAVLLTHAHIDHAGMLPLLYKQGFGGPIYCTRPTADLCGIMLMDSAHIQESDAEWKNRKNQRSGRPLVEPVYTQEDAQGALKQFVACEYNTPLALFPGFSATFTDVGHLLGSASITVDVQEADKTERIVFSGDIGNSNQPLIKDPSYLTRADYLVMESTYGDRTHGPRPDYVRELTEILQETFDRGGNVVIPSFAVGRTQELLYFLRQIKEEGRVHGHAHFPVYVDSPLANEATKIFIKNDYECYDEDAMALLKKGIDPLGVPDLKISSTSDDSKAINFDETPKVILSASGMCDAGRIRHHLKHNLWRPECTVLFVGYQAEGTLGRSLVEGTKEVRLFGETIEVNAHICQMTGLSGHADHDGLLTWLEHFDPKPAKVFLNHGDDAVCDAFCTELVGRGFEAEAPYSGGEYDLHDGKVTCLAPGNRTRRQPVEPGTPGGRPMGAAFSRLSGMGQRLLEVIRHNSGGANKDLAKFAAELQALCDRWDH